MSAPKNNAAARDHLEWVCAVAYQCVGVLSDDEFTGSKKQTEKLFDMLAAASRGKHLKAKRIADKLLPFKCIRRKTIKKVKP